MPQYTASQYTAFDQLPQDETPNLPLSQVDASGTPLFNFALARVRMQAPASTPPVTVRVFFRTFPASTTAVSYDEQTTYRWYPEQGTGDLPPPPDAGTDRRIALLGIDPSQSPPAYVTIPFFATQRQQLTDNTKPMTWQTDPPNVQTMQGSPSSGVVEAYFGCWLDINQTSPVAAFFPQSLPSDPTLMDGPFTGALMTIAQRFNMDLHQCLVAEISTDATPIPPGDVPQFSPWLAQRNLGLIPGG